MNGEFRWNAAAFPGMHDVREGCLYQFQPHAIGVGEGKHGLAESLRELFKNDAARGQPLSPKSQRVLRYARTMRR